MYSVERSMYSAVSCARNNGGVTAALRLLGPSRRSAFITTGHYFNKLSSSKQYIWCETRINGSKHKLFIISVNYARATNSSANGKWKNLYSCQISQN